MSAPWLSVVGIGPDGWEGLAPAARALVAGAEVLVGGQRHLDMVPSGRAERMAWGRPFGHGVEQVMERRGRARVCVLASGDPMFFGVGVTFARRLPADEMTVVPAPSAASLACAWLGWPLAEVEVLTLHGRPLELLHPWVQPGARLLVLSEGAGTPMAVARRLADLGHGGATLTVLENLGGPDERVRTATAAGFALEDVADLNILAVACASAPDAPLRPRVPGLPDAAFRHDGQLTKREVRAATLAALGPVPGQLLWDVGAGCGSVAIEWMRTHRRCRAVAIEREPERAALAAGNAAALGVPGLRIVEGAAPDTLRGLDAPDAEFVGGGVSDPAVMDAAWDALGAGGRLVANAVTAEGEMALLARHARFGGEVVRLSAERLAPLGGYRAWRPQMSVTQWSVTKT